MVYCAAVGCRSNSSKNEERIKVDDETSLNTVSAFIAFQPTSHLENHGCKT